ncbi:hypothetical protein [Streptomyces sp. AB3(2024)]|uniref:hypothetical protein n=1 Tax=Streptomyces sp. AB3(2024) TaxID=3317321 RepID=UPI0035A2E1C4
MVMVQIEGPDTLLRIPVGRQKDLLSSDTNWTVTNQAVITARFGDTVKDAAATRSSRRR